LGGASSLPPSGRRALAVLAGALLISTFAGALHDASHAWDSLYYHLPFAARLAGILPPSAYVFSAANQARFDGFPLLGELLQGLLWRLSGRPEFANLVAFAAIPALAWFMARRFRVPWYLSVLALLSIPLVQAHASSCYVDLPANAAAAVVVLLTFEAYASKSPVPVRDLVLACGAAALAANVKELLHPILLVALVALAVRAIQLEPRRRLVLSGGFAFALVLVFATPLKNLALHHNPYYPVHWSALGLDLPGPEEPYASSPLWLEHAPRPVRFVCSLLEVGLRPLTSTRRWTVDQWMPEDARGYRMGGFFGAAVVAHLFLLAWRAMKGGSRAVRKVALAFVAFTALVSVMPQSHELRYYMVWMIALVLLNLRLCLPSPAPAGEGSGMGAGVGAAWEGSGTGAATAGEASAMGATALVCVASLGVVLAVTRCSYVYPSGIGFDQMVRAEVDPSVLSTVHDGSRVCVRDEPWDILWAARFHPPRRYVVKEGETSTECAGYRTVD